MKYKISFLCGYLSISMSIVTLVLFFIKVHDLSIVDISTFIGVSAAFIGISVTLLVGYQIINVLDFRNKLAQVEEVKKVLEKQREETQIINHQQQEGFNILLARLYSQDCQQTLNTVLYFMRAIPYSLSLPQKAVGYSILLDELKVYMLNVTIPSFGSGSHDFIKRKVEEFRELFSPIDNEIRANINFLYIKDKYSLLVEEFNIRLDNIAVFNNVSITEMTGIIKVKNNKNKV